MLRENLKTAYSLLIYGQCSDALRAKLESRPANHATIKGAADSIGLLENMSTVIFQFQSERYSPLALHHEAKHRYYSFSQDQLVLSGPTHDVSMIL
jgi:hypothetical protein